MSLTNVNLRHEQETKKQKLDFSQIIFNLDSFVSALIAIGIYRLAAARL